VSAFEQNLVALDVKLEEAQKLGKAVVAAIGRTRAALKVGRVADISRGLGVISQRIDQANAAVDGLANVWSFDVSGYLADGGFIADLKQAAAEQDLLLFENDGRIYCFPLLLRIDAKGSPSRSARGSNAVSDRASSSGCWRTRKGVRCAFAKPSFSSCCIALGGG